MPNIKISELTAPIAVSDADLLPAVQSGVTRKLSWGALKSTLSGALGRTYLELGTAAVANLTTSTTDTTAGRVMKVGDFGLGAISVLSDDWNAITVNGFYRNASGSAVGIPISGRVYAMIHSTHGSADAWQIATETYSVTADTYPTYIRVKEGGVWKPWREIWTSSGTNAITVDTGSLGYGTGSGGTVTQSTSKSTAVTLNKPSGQITTAPAALAANTVASFTLTNNKIGANDIPKVVIKSGATAGAYVVQVDAVAAGSCRISIRNMTAGSLSETLVLQFNNEKGAVA